MLLSLTPLKAAVAVAAGTGMLLTGGVAAAAAGSLPGNAQDAASEMLAKVGVTVPGADDLSAGHADQRGSSVTTPAGDAADHGKGRAVSELAKSLDGARDKGAAISELASEGRSHAGEHAGDAQDEAASTASKAGVDTPNLGGTASPDNVGDADASDTAEDAAGEATEAPAADGADTADDASDGTSTTDVQPRG